MISNPALVLPTIRQAVVEFQATIDALTEGHWSKLNAEMVKEIQAKKAAHCELQKVLESQVIANSLPPAPMLNVGDEDYEIDN